MSGLATGGRVTAGVGTVNGTGRHGEGRHAAGPSDSKPRAAAWNGAARLARARTTPGRLAVMVVTAIGLACVLGLLPAIIFDGLNGGFTTIGNTNAPLVEQSTGLYFSANDMDAQLANVLLAGDDPALATDRQEDLTTYQQDRNTADQDLQQITATAAADPAAQRQAGAVLGALGQYEALAADAILVNQDGHDPAGRPSASTLNYFQQATDLMSGQILPAAKSLTNVNASALNTSYDQNRSAAKDGVWWVLVLGFVLVGVLAAAQFYLARRYRRLLNPALALATLLAAGLAIGAAVQLSAQSNHLYVAKVEAFDSIEALTQARAVSFDANADESRYLVDPARAAQYQDSFLTKSQQIAYVGNVGIFQYDAAFAREIDAYQANNANVEFGGYLGAEFRNITFPGERAAAVKTLLAFQLYERDDRVLRNLAKTNLDTSIAYDVGTNPGQSDWAFNNYAADLGSVITINENAFTAAIADGHSTGSGWNGLIPAVAVLAVAALVIVGTRPRFAEYH
jgi:hypothetical protein